MSAYGLGIPVFRGVVAGNFVYWSSAESTPVGATNITRMPNGIPGVISPYDVPDLLMWYRSDYGVVLTGSSRVHIWRDLSGNQFHAQQGVHANRPFFTASYVSMSNKPVVDFTATGPQELTATHDTRQSPRQQTIFLAGEIKSSFANYNTFFSKADNSSWLTGWSMGSRSGNGQMGFWCQSWTPFFEKTYTKPTSIIAVGINGVTGSYRSNRVLRGMFSTGSYAPATGPVRIGSAAGDYGCNGLISEIIMYGRALTDSEVLALENYLVSRYGQGDQ